MFSLPHLDWKPVFEFRARFERRVDRDFDSDNADGRRDLFSRVRAGASFASRSVQGRIVYQYAHDENYNPKRNSALWRSDVLLGYATVPVGGGGLTLGRQRLQFGSERLLGAAEWNNVSNAWDGGRYDRGRLGVFGVKQGVLPTPDDEVRLTGAAWNFGTVQGLVVQKHDDRGGIDETTLSGQYRGKLGPATLDAEAAGQVGHRNGLRKQAGAVDVIASVPVARRLTASVQASVASGGSDGNTNRTFDLLYGSVHDKHGLADVTGWKNSRDLAALLRYAPDRRTEVKFQIHGFALDSARDAWYNAGGAPNPRPGGTFVDPTGGHGRDLGHEVDLDFARTLDPHRAFRVGVSLFRPGRFVRGFNGASTTDQVWGYVQYAYRF